MRKHILQFFGGCAIVSTVVASVFWYVGNHYSNYSAEKNIIVDQTNDDYVVDLFQKRNISKNSFVTKIYLKIFRFFKKNVLFGEYELPTHVSIIDALNIITSGNVVIHKICIPEGFSVAQVVDRLNANEYLQGQILDTPKEGSLMPDTYRFKYPATKQAIILMASHAMNKFILEAWENRPDNCMLKSAYELIILASIVEKERTKTDAKIIAKIYLNRLQINMPLQADPTVIYAITHGRRLGRPLTFKDLKEKIPGNTYVYKGLPETPICNPSREAIEAVLYPSNHDFLFFAHDSSGRIYLAKTYKEHLCNAKIIRSTFDKSLFKKEQIK